MVLNSRIKIINPLGKFIKNIFLGLIILNLTFLCGILNNTLKRNNNSTTKIESGVLAESSVLSKSWASKMQITDKTIVTKIEFKKSASMPEINGTTVFDVSDTGDSGIITGQIDADGVVKISSMAEIKAPVNCYCLFYDYPNVTSIDLSNFFVTSNTTNMSFMFYKCTRLKTLTFNDNWDTRNVTNMSNMFNKCTGLNNLDRINLWNTRSVTDTSYMLTNCSNLTSLDLSGWNTNSITKIDNMFAYCSSLISLDLSGWNTSNVTDIRHLFDNCSSLSNLKGIGSWDTSKITDMRAMFQRCSSLTSLDLSDWDTSKVTDMGWMFFCCEDLNSLNLNGWDNSIVKDVEYMFCNCSSLISLDLSWLNMVNVIKIDCMIDAIWEIKEFIAPYNIQSGKTLKLPYGNWYQADSKTYETTTQQALTDVTISSSNTLTSSDGTKPTEIRRFARAFDINIDLKGGTLTGVNPIIYYYSGFKETSISLAIPSKEGYTFTGYSFVDDLTFASVKNKITLTIFAKANSELYLKANYELSTYTLTIYKNDGSNTTTTQTFTHGVAQNIIEQPFTRTGYAFVGWAESENGAVEYADKTSLFLTENKNLYAKWTANAYTVKFNSNSGSGEMSDQEFTYDVAQNLRVNTYAKTGYTFIGWSETANGEVKYLDNESVNNLSTTNNDTITLYAKWAANKYNIIFNKNTGTGEMPDQEFTYDVSQKLNINLFTKVGFMFIGWSETVDGEVKYIDKEEILVAENVTLYAQWYRFRDGDIIINIALCEGINTQRCYGVVTISYNDVVYECTRKTCNVIKNGTIILNNLYHGEYTITIKTTHNTMCETTSITFTIDDENKAHIIELEINEKVLNENIN